MRLSYFSEILYILLCQKSSELKVIDFSSSVGKVESLLIFTLSKETGMQNFGFSPSSLRNPKAFEVPSYRKFGV